MKKSPASMTLLGHDIGVGGWRLSSCAQPASVDATPATIIEDNFSGAILTDKSGAQERKRNSGSSQAHQHVVRGAAGPLRLRSNVSKLFRLRIHIDDFDLIDDPIASREETLAVLAGSLNDFHFKRATGGTVNATGEQVCKRFLRIQEFLFKAQGFR